MLRFYYIFFTFLSISLSSQSSKGFKIPDSLQNRSYEQLNRLYDKVFQIDNNASELYANTILCKGKKEQKMELIYDGYYKLAHAKSLDPKEGQPYADSLLIFTKNINTKEYPAKAYIIKGILLYKEFKYREALDYYIKAQNVSKDKNEDQYFYLKKLIGILKSNTEENKEALSLFLEYYNYQKKSFESKQTDVKKYIGSIFSVSNAFIKTKEYSKSKFYNKIGLTECKKYNDYSHYGYFLMSEGISDYYLKNYQKAEEYLLKVERILLKNHDHPNLAVVYYFLGKIYIDAKDHNNGINYFIKADSISLISNDFLPITRDGYEILIDYYKKKEDKENQLKYINKLFYADSIINNNKQYLSKDIYKKYDTPILLEEKEKLISKLSYKNYFLYCCLGLGVLVIMLLIHKYLKNRKKVEDYKNQAEVLLKTFEESKAPVLESDLIISLGNSENKHKTKNTLSNDRLQHIQNKIENFEEKKGFLQKNITLDSLAKELKTNRDYLSKSVNELKGKNFSQYINDLRINYVIDELTYNEKLRKFTISAIADEVGFNTAESFSNAFRKSTGTLPSFYIKLLNDKKK